MKPFTSKHCSPLNFHGGSHLGEGHDITKPMKFEEANAEMV